MSLTLSPVLNIRGNKIFFITGQPTDANASPIVGDVAFATDTQLFYQRISTGWPTTGTLLRGQMGLTGVNGASFYSGPNAPSSSTPGNNGDLYLVLTTGEIYKYASGSWTDQGYSIQGPPGVKGDAGPAGQRGSLILYGTGDFVAANYPNAIAGLDYYVNRTTGDFSAIVNS